MINAIKKISKVIVLICILLIAILICLEEEANKDINILLRNDVINQQQLEEIQKEIP